jgi:hypothetical protein
VFGIDRCLVIQVYLTKVSYIRLGLNFNIGLYEILFYSGFGLDRFRGSWFHPLVE